MNGPTTPKRVLIVEDDRQVQTALHEVFMASGYKCQLAGNGQEGLEAFEVDPPPLTITDIKMPVMDGITFLKHARAKDPDAAVIVLTGYGDIKTAVESLKQGASDFILKPVNMEQMLIAAERALERRQLLMERREYQATLERRVTEATRDLAVALRELETTYQATLEALGSAIETRDVATELHSRRVYGYAIAIARAHGMPESETRDLGRGVLLHDIGKIGIPDAILLKPGPLSPEEWQIMRSHPEKGRRLLERIPFLRGAIPIVYHHHERWDGTGYPMGLRGEAIPLGARIFAVADAFDALTFDRPYSRAIPVEEARERIRQAAGSHFDPAVVRTFLAMPLALLAKIREDAMQEYPR
jgi:response regulator RpfG family c-di-GMP phosphodiesterase